MSSMPCLLSDSLPMPETRVRCARTPWAIRESPFHTLSRYRGGALAERSALIFDIAR